jgi:hypothetical protein
MQPFRGSAIDWEAAEPRNRQSCLEPCGVMPVRLFAVRCNRRYLFRRLLRAWL